MRIVAGRFRGRTLVAPSGAKTRPTSALVRGALFDILGDGLDGAYAADLFAGTGALGLEALSRGARRVDLYESHRPALFALRRNLEALAVRSETAVVSGPLPDSIGAGTPYDLVFIDPPWRMDHEQKAVERLVSRRRLAPSARIIIESAKDHALDPTRFVKLGLALDDARVYGDTVLHFFSAPAAPVAVVPDAPQAGGAEA